MVPLPPILRRPNLRNGAEHVVMLGVIWRVTITLEGSCGISLSVIVKSRMVKLEVEWRGYEDEWMLLTLRRTWTVEIDARANVMY